MEVTTRRQQVDIKVLFIALLTGCGPAHGSDPSFWEPYVNGESVSQSTTTSSMASGGSGFGGAGGNGSNGGNGGNGGTVANAGKLVFDFTTVSLNGKYAPKNVGAVWITDGSGAFVRTLELWAAKRVEHLVKWNANSGANIVDAVTGATRGSHGAHNVVWDGMDAAGVTTAQGEYHLNVEFTEWNSSDGGMSPGPFTSIAFLRGPTKQDSMLADLNGFTAMHLVYEP